MWRFTPILALLAGMIPVLAAEAPGNITPVDSLPRASTLRSSIYGAYTQRIPIEDSDTQVISERVLIPPSLRLQGLFPRVTFTQGYTDNLFFTPDNERDDLITILSAGLHYSKILARGQLDTDLQTDSTFYEDNTDLNDTLESYSGLVTGNYALTRNNRIEIFNLLSTFKNPFEQIVSGPRFSRTGRVRQNLLELRTLHSAGPRLDLRAQYRNFYTRFEKPEKVQSITHVLDLGMNFRLSEQDFVGITYRHTTYDTENNSTIFSEALLFDYRHQLTKTVTLEASLGGSQERNISNNGELIATIYLQQLNRSSLFRIGYEHDLSPSDFGTDSVFLIETLSLSLRKRLAKGLQALLEYENSSFKAIDDAIDDLKSSEIRTSLTYAFLRSWMLRVSHVYSNEQQRNTNDEVISNRINLNIVKSFDPNPRVYHTR